MTLSNEELLFLDQMDVMLTRTQGLVLICCDIELSILISVVEVASDVLLLNLIAVDSGSSGVLLPIQISAVVAPEVEL